MAKHLQLKNEDINENFLADTCDSDQKLEFKDRRPTLTQKRISELDMIPQQIKNDALQILNDVHVAVSSRTFKQKTQDEIIFYCLFHSYNKNEIPIDPKYILKLLGINSKKFSINKALALNLNENKNLSQNFETLTTFYLTNYFNLLKDHKIPINKDKKIVIIKAIKFINSILDEEDKHIYKWIRTTAVSKAVIGMLSSFIYFSGVEINLKLWCSACSMTQGSITKYKKSFESALNE